MFHDLEDARKAGFDTCEHCLPLICNMSPTKMEAHKLFCPDVREIKQRNRIEVHSWAQAAKLGFNGCYYCLRKYHVN